MSQKPINTLTQMQNGFAEMKNDYRMSKSSRFNRDRKGLAQGGGTGDYHLRNERDFYNNMEKARDMDRNDAFGSQILDRLGFNIFQDGFKIDPKTGDGKLDKMLKDRWNEEACDPEMMDIAGEMCWHDIEYATGRATFRDGDCAVVGTEDGPYQFFEGHVIATDSDKENTIHGIEIDDVRRKVRLWITQDSNDPDDNTKMEERGIDFTDSEGVKQVFHVYNPKRTTMTRGMTAFAPIFEYAGMLEDINFAKLVQQQIVSCFAIFRKQQIGGALPSTDGESYGSATEQTTTTGETRQLDNVSPGMEIIGNPGEELEGFSPNVPNSEYFQQVELIMRLMSTTLGIPLMVLLLDASQTNFSGWRGAIDEARKGFRYHQRNFIKRLHTPAYIWRVNYWAATDPALKRAINNAKVKAFKHKWNPPAWNYIEPLKDATSDLLRVQNRLVSPTELHNERGRDYMEVLAQSIKDNSIAIEMAIKEAQRLSKKLGQEINYLELLSSPTSDGASVVINTGSEGGGQQ